MQVPAHVKVHGVDRVLAEAQGHKGCQIHRAVDSIHVMDDLMQLHQIAADHGDAWVILQIPQRIYIVESDGVEHDDLANITRQQCFSQV